MKYPQSSTVCNALEIYQMLERLHSHPMAVVRNNNHGLELYNYCGPPTLTVFPFKDQSPRTLVSCYDNVFRCYLVRGGEIFDQTEDLGSPEIITPDQCSEMLLPQGKKSELVSDEISLQSNSKLQKSDSFPITRGRRRRRLVGAIGSQVSDEDRANDPTSKSYNLWRAARRWIGQATAKWISRKEPLDRIQRLDEKQESYFEHNFDELDEILQNNNNTHSDDKVGFNSLDKTTENGEQKGNTTKIEDWVVGNFSSTPPQDASLLKGWNRRALRSWLYKVSLFSL